MPSRLWASSFPLPLVLPVPGGRQHFLVVSQKAGRPSALPPRLHPRAHALCLGAGDEHSSLFWFSFPFPCSFFKLKPRTACSGHNVLGYSSGDLSLLPCSLIMFYFVALAGAHRRVVIQLREQLSLVRRLRPRGPCRWHSARTPCGKSHRSRGGSGPTVAPAHHLCPHTLPAGLAPSSCLPSFDSFIPSPKGTKLLSS